MEITISKNVEELGKTAAKVAAEAIKKAITEKGAANIILATGASQFTTLAALVLEPNIDWAKVTMFHLDEYVGMPETHKASFRKYLKERFLQKLPPLKNAFLINAETDAEEVCKKLSDIIEIHPIDMALVGIGENGHIAFNDPPADFETQKPYFVVDLSNEACRQQQFGEGWFETIDEVPEKCITMSVAQIMKSKTIVSAVPEARKALAVKNTLQQEVSNLFPSTMLKNHPNCHLFLDVDSASLL